MSTPNASEPVASPVQVGAATNPVVPTDKNGQSLFTTANPGVISGSLTPATNQRVNTQAGDIAAGSAVAGSFVDGAITTMGTEADAAWSLSGSATEIAIIKKIALELSAQLNTALSDGVTSTLKASVGPYHVTYNQSLATIVNALATAVFGVLTNPSGTGDPQISIGQDGQPLSGIQASGSNLVGPQLTTTVNMGGGITGSPTSQTITANSTASLKVKDQITFSDNGDWSEVITVPSGTTFTAIVKNNHANGTTLTWNHANMARDASIGDQVPLTGLSPSQTYLYNAITGLAELERSANGEFDLASIGMNVAAPFVFLSGAPGGYNYMRERGIVGLVQGGAASNISSGGGTGSTSITMTGAPTGLQPGTPVELTGGTGSPEWVWTAKNYTAGATPVVLDAATPIAGNNRTTMLYPIFGAQGPGLGDYVLIGEAAEMQLIWNDATKRPRAIQSATTNGAPYGNSPMEAVGLDNGTTLDKWKGTAGVGNVLETNSAAIKTDLDTLVTNTADLLADGDNLATINTNTANIPAKGTAVMTGSTPVTIATNDTVFAEMLLDTDNLATILTALQGVLQIKRSAVAVYSLASTVTTGSTQNSGDLTVGLYTEIGIDINTTAQAGTSPTLQLFYERKGADGIYYVLWQSAVLTAAANTISTSIGAGMAYNQSLGLTGRLRWVVGGSATPTYTFSANIYGK